MLANRICDANYIPHAIRKAFRCGESPDADPETVKLSELWREVAARLTLDALGYTGETEELKHTKAMRDARIWFKMSIENVITVFEFARIHPQIVRETVIATKPLTRNFDKSTDDVDTSKKFEVVVKPKRMMTPCRPSNTTASKSPIPKSLKSPNSGGTRTKSSPTKPRC